MERQYVTSADIARIAQVSRTTVSNWRRRHDSFPPPAGGTGNRPLFDRVHVERWLAEVGRLPEQGPADLLWGAVQEAVAGGHRLDEVVARVQGILLHLSRGDRDEGSPAVDGEDPLATAVREAVTEPGAAGVLSRHVHDAYLAALDGRIRNTNGTLARLMVALAGVDGADVLDPASAGGELLWASLEAGAAAAHGQEARPELVRPSQARAALAARGRASVRVEPGTALASDAWAGRSFDVVVCYPPFNQRDWAPEDLAYDERWVHGVPPRTEPELAWLQHCLAHTRPGGHSVILLPPAVASRPSGRRIRRGLLRSGALSAVMALPPGASAPTHVGLHLWVLRQPEPQRPIPNDVLLVDASEDATDAPGDMRGLHEKITGLHGRWAGAAGEVEDAPGLSRVVPVIDLLDDSVDLTPQRHLPVTAPDTDPREAHTGATEARSRLLTALSEAVDAVPEHTWTVGRAEPRPVTTVAELARSGAVTLHRAVPGAGTGEPGAEPAGGPAVLTVSDVLGGGRPSGRGSSPKDGASHTVIRPGDVVVPSLIAKRGLSRAWVADEDANNAVLGDDLHLLRPDPDRLDPWFLAGFLEDADNLRQAGTGSTIVRVDLKRLILPLLPLAEQRRYGDAFRDLHRLRRRVDAVRRSEDDLQQRIASGMRAGLLEPGRTGGSESEPASAVPHIRQT